VTRTPSVPARRGLGIHLAIAALAAAASIACAEDSLEPIRQRLRERADIAILVGEGNTAVAGDHWGRARDAYREALRLDESNAAVRALADRAATYASDRETLRDIERARPQAPEEVVVARFDSIGADSPFKEPARQALARWRENRLAEESKHLADTLVGGPESAPDAKTPAPAAKAPAPKGQSVEELVTQSEALVKEQQYEPALRHCEGALRKDDRNLRAATACAIAACNLRDLKKARDHLKRLGASTERLNAARQICIRLGLQV
jgi:tetratricopeptide (TPR) repeat protein